MSDQLAAARLALIDALITATLDKRLDWIRTNPDEVKWKEDTIEQRYAMISEDGVFATFSRMRNGNWELLIQVQETGCYREYEITRADGEEAQAQLANLYAVLPSTLKMMEDFHMVIDRLQSTSGEAPRE
ncbi:MAG: hypothetical protein AB1489_08900 [Acidobacteriota bacterium]